MRRPRGRLSSVDLLPEAAEEDVQWAYEQLKRRKRPQAEILDQLNLRLKLKSIPPISRSAFNRASIRLMRMATRLEETREIAGVLAAKLDAAGGDDLTLLLGETIKMLVYEMLENAGNLKADGLTAEMMMNFARALKFAEDSRRITADTRARIERDFKAKASEAVEAAARAKGLTRETVDAIKAQILNIDRAAKS
ncbi:MAG: DUF3486 family protein [Xanthobacteraceae bacterium]